MECSFNYHYNYTNSTHRFSYNLCPLFLHQQSFKHEIIVETPPTQTNYVYDIALGAGIKKDGTLPASLQCPPNSFVCLTMVNTRPDHPTEQPRILQVVPVASGDIRPRFRITNTTTGLDQIEYHLQLTVNGLQYMKQKQRGVFHVRCDKTLANSSFDSQIDFLYTWNGTHVFSWKTIHGCPEIIELPNKPEEGPDSNDGSEEPLPPPDPEPSDGIPSTTASPLSLLFFAFATILSVSLSLINS